MSTQGLAKQYGILILAIPLIVSCLSHRPASTLKYDQTPITACKLDFPYKQGWLGGDAIFSVDLQGKDQRTLWLFGDTFINENNPKSRQGGSMSSLTIGISTCKDHTFHIDYHWGHHADGSVAPFFAPPSDHIWPGHGIIVGKKLYLFAIKVEKNKDKYPVFGFGTIGTYLITVDNYQDTPNHWTYHITEFNKDPELIIGVSVLKESDTLLLYSTRVNAPGQPAIVLRCPLTQLEACPLEIFTDQGWELYSQAKISQAQIVIPYASTEFSVFVFQDKHYVVNNSLTWGFPADSVTVSTSRAVTGPFGNPQKIAKFPDNAYFGTKQAYCYAAKAVPSLVHDGQIPITYVCNSMDFLGETLSHLSLYQVQTLYHRL